MSNGKAVANKVYSLGSATQRDLSDHFPEWTAQQLLDAIKNARALGLIHCEGRVPKKGSTGSGSLPARNYPGPKPEGTPSHKARTRPQVAPIASVWELGTPKDIQVPKERGRVFNLLGGWTD